MTVCGRPELAGGTCELEEGHDGAHQCANPNGSVFRWTDASQQRLLDRYGGSRGT